MTDLSKTQIASAWLITLNSIAINITVMLNQIKSSRPSEEYREKSQMEKVLDNSTIKVAIYRNTAYWVVNNIIYRARVDIDGRVLDHEAEQIDVFKLSDKEVDNLLLILDSINK